MSFLQILAALLVMVAIVLCLVRLWIGPTLPDRVVAADTASVITTAAIAWLALGFGQDFYLDIALVYGALAFVGVVTIARVLEGGNP